MAVGESTTGLREAAQEAPARSTRRAATSPGRASGVGPRGLLRFFGREPSASFADVDPRLRRFLAGGVITLITTTILCLYLLPFGYMAATSLKSEQQITRSTILPRSVDTIDYSRLELSLVHLVDASGAPAGVTVAPAGAAAGGTEEIGAGDAVETVLWDGSWDQLLAAVDGDLTGATAYTAGSARTGESLSVLLGDDATVLVDESATPRPLDHDGSEESLLAALAATGYELDEVALFAMAPAGGPSGDTTGETAGEATGDVPALALLRPGAAIDALVDPKLLPTRLEWDGTVTGLESAVAAALGEPLADLQLYTVPEADGGGLGDGSLKGLGLLPPAGDPAVFVDPAVTVPEPVDWDGTEAGLVAVLDETFAPAAHQLELRRVPLPDGTVRELALLEPGPTSSLFVDPADPTGPPILWEGRIQQAEPVLHFDPQLDNYPDAWEALDFARRLRNTAVIAGFGMAGTVISSTLVAYGLSRFRIPYKGLIVTSLVATIILPRFVTLVPSYIVYERIGWVGTWWPLILPHFFSNAYNVFLLRQFFLTIPRELDEAASIDGAGPLRTLLLVILPQARGALLAVALFHFFFAWNDFLEPLLYLVSKPELQPISVGLYFFIGVFDSNIPLIQAGALLGMAVPIVIFLLLQRIFLRGIDLSGALK